MELVDIGHGHKLNEKAAPAFLAMQASAAKEGIALPVNVSVRPRKRQQELYDAWIAAGSPPATPVAKPNGSSEHDESNANGLDINQASDARILPWLCRHGPDFGFYATARGEKWHWAHYSGHPPAARYIRHLLNLKAWEHG